MQGKPKKEDPMSLEQAVDDSENLTDFLMDFEEEEWGLSTRLQLTIWFASLSNEWL